ncbi:MAG: T9SS type A sorting domain-containing protein [Bacteroidia bacterium]
MRKIYSLVITFLIVSATFMNAQTTTIVNPAAGGGFESGTTFAANGWTVCNGGGSAANWNVGTGSAPQAGARCAFVGLTTSTNDYDHSTSDDIHFYQNVTIPAGQATITLSFNWKGYGESCCDYLEVYLVPTTYTPVAGTSMSSSAYSYLGHYNLQSSWQSASISLPCSNSGTTQRLVFTWHNDGSVGTDPAGAIDNVSLVSVGAAGGCAGLLGTGVINVASLPYASGAGTTCGAVNDITSSNSTSCGSSLYQSGEDQVYIFTPASSGPVNIAITSAGSYVGLTLFDGCPMNCSASPGTCVDYSQSSSGNQSMCYPVISGHTYYLIVDSWSPPSCNAYSNLTISAPAAALQGTVCSNAPFITLPYTATSQTTACYGDDYNNSSVASCGSLYESGEDRVYAYTSAGGECMSIILSNINTTEAGVNVYLGCPDVSGSTCIAHFGGSNPLNGTAILSAAGTYYIIVDTWSTPFNCTYDINITSNSTPPNDLPCNATPLTLNVTTVGNTVCSGIAGEPALPGCWYGGETNTVWYSVVCPASGKLSINTSAGTLTNTEIALYSGTCGAGLTYVDCNEDFSCGSNGSEMSQLVETGLTPGATYYIEVSGDGTVAGTFSIVAVDGNVGLPSSQGQDCSLPNPVCSQIITVGNPGYQGIGTTCDFGSSVNCLLSGERGSDWYTIPILSNGNLVFDIVPNDWPGAPSTSSTDYDFAVWKTGGTGATTCAGIAGGAAPVSCNYSFLGVTGCYGASNGTNPAAYPGYSASYNAQIPVLAGETYLMIISNFSNSTSGFTINFNTSPINYAPSAPTINWTGGANTTVWGTTQNWGGCSVPSCTISAIVGPASASQPVLVTGNTYTVNNLTINPGGVLTLQTGSTLYVCGNYLNNGSLVANPGATIVFDGTGTQTIDGTLIGSNAMPNLTITKASGTVVLNQNMDIAGSFTTSNATSIFNSNGKYIKLAGNFTNFSGATTFTNVTGGTLEFNGTSQTYSSGALFSLNNVTMNQSATTSTVTVSGFNMQLGTSGVLTFTKGRIVTNALKVTQLNTAVASVTVGNTNSYVDGNLQRYLSGAAAAYDFPVGYGVPAGYSPGGGYQRANIAFTTATTIGNLTARFDLWGGANPALAPEGQNEAGCGMYTVNDLDNGFWTISANATPTSGTYNTTLYSTNYSNSALGVMWEVTKNTALTAGGWYMDGVCVNNASPAVVVRNAMNGFSWFAVAQSIVVLPVELISFTGKNENGINYLNWETATETNNNYFLLERSSDGLNFEELGLLSGAGTTSTAHSYNFTDNHPPHGISYYRFKQVDFNGKYVYSNIVPLLNTMKPVILENIYPNPTTQGISFDFFAPVKGNVTIEMMDVVGRTLFTETKGVNAGKNILSEDMLELSAGSYYMKVTFDAVPYISTHKVIKQ